MQKFLQWLDDHGLLDPLEKALGILGFVLFCVWCFALALVTIIGLPILAIAISAWWLLAYIPLLVLIVCTFTFYFYIDQMEG